MSKTDNIFAKVISNPAICKEYGITDPERYDNIALGLKSSNGYVQAIAQILKEVSFTYESKRQDMAIRHKEGTVVLEENEMKSIYRKIVGILEKTR
ncbi:MAG: hypothetical protein WC125_12915 [Bacteroidales bacterium]|jgi:hypothetical protein